MTKKYSDFDPGTPATTDIILYGDPSTGALSKTALSNISLFPAGTKVYAALLSQSSTDAPVATVLVNTLGGTVVWTRDDAGIYFATLAGAFSNASKVFVTHTPTIDGSNFFVYEVFDSNSIRLVSTADTDMGATRPFSFKILVFP